jgi:predicted RNA-binding protein with PUA-like domain
MNHWLVKSEPETYSWQDFVNKDYDMWNGVRNYQARNYLKAMKNGDQVLFYHSGKEKAIVGVAQVCKEHYADPTSKDNRWVVVDLKPIIALNNPVTLEKVKFEPRLAGIPLLKQSRLSVMPLNEHAYKIIITLGK